MSCCNWMSGGGWYMLLINGARGRRCGTACHLACLPLLVAAVRVRPSPNLPQYGRPRHCAAVVPTQPPALLGELRPSIHGSGKIRHLPGNPPLLRSPAKIYECGTAETPTSNPRYCTGEENVQSWNVFTGIRDRAAGQTKPAKSVTSFRKGIVATVLYKAFLIK